MITVNKEYIYIQVSSKRVPYAVNLISQPSTRVSVDDVNYYKHLLNYLRVHVT